MKGTDILLTSYEQKIYDQLQILRNQKVQWVEKALDTVTIITYIFYKGLHKK